MMATRKKQRLRFFATLISLLGLMVVIIMLTPSFKLPNERDNFLKAYQLDGLSVVELVAYLEHAAHEEGGLHASITGQYLYIGNDDHTYPIDLPDQAFYLSIAPYLNQTHPCANHNLITCRGELKNQNFEVTIVNLSNGQRVTETYQSSPQGFFGLWLVRDQRYQITVQYGDMHASTIIETTPTSNTCLTTLQLS